MRVAVASGKGGTGKTTVATALARTAASQGLRVTYVDCDVEAPNGHLLLHPEIGERRRITRLVPDVDFERCRRCGACAEACQFGAIVCVGTTVQLYPNLCRSCGACVAACPNGAIGEVPYAVGWVETGHADSLGVVRGVLDIGQPRAIPVIKAAQDAVPAAMDLVVLDAPPGVSCPTVTVLRDADAVLLVAEETAFGLADLRIALATVQTRDKPTMVVINRCDLGDRRVHEFCASRGLSVVAEIPYSREIADGYARGDLEGVVGQLQTTLENLMHRLDNVGVRRAS